MARTLRDKDIEIVVGIIDGWKGKLTYERLIDEAAVPLKHRFTRQALFSHVRIREAFNSRKMALRDGSNERQVKSVELQKALERIDRLEAENRRLKQECESLLAQFVRWAHNAHCKGLTPEFLNRPMHEVDRGSSRLR